MRLRSSMTRSMQLLLGLGLLALAGPAFAQDIGEVTDLFVTDFDNSYPAPDGVHLVYQPADQHETLVLLDTRDGSRTAIPLPEEEGFSLRVPDYGGFYYTPLSWSPDSTKFAFTGADYWNFYEGDLWIYDLETESWTNATDDGYDARAFQSTFFRGEEVSSSRPLKLESQPAWSPDGQVIAFERYAYQSDDPGVAMISLLDVATGEIQDVAPVPKGESEVPNMSTVSTLEWSPDGTQLYIGVGAIPSDPEVDGIYRLDIASGTVEKLLGPSALDGIFEGAAGTQTPEETLLFYPFRVSPDGDQLLLWGGWFGGGALYWPMIFDLESETLTPVVPFLSSDDAERQPGSPLNAVWSPDGEQVLVLSRLWEENDAPELLPVTEAAMLLGRYSSASGEFEVLGRLPVNNPAAGRFGEWNASGNVLLGNFHFTFE